MRQDRLSYFKKMCPIFQLSCKITWDHVPEQSPFLKVLPDVHMIPHCQCSPIQPVVLRTTIAKVPPWPHGPISKTPIPAAQLSCSEIQLSNKRSSWGATSDTKAVDLQPLEGREDFLPPKRDFFQTILTSRMVAFTEGCG